MGSTICVHNSWDILYVYIIHGIYYMCTYFMGYTICVHNSWYILYVYIFHGIYYMCTYFMGYTICVHISWIYYMCTYFMDILYVEIFHGYTICVHIWWDTICVYIFHGIKYMCTYFMEYTTTHHTASTSILPASISILYHFPPELPRGNWNRHHGTSQRQGLRHHLTRFYESRLNLTEHLSRKTKTVCGAIMAEQLLSIFYNNKLRHWSLETHLYVHMWTVSSFFLVMSCHQFPSRPLLVPRVMYCQFATLEQISIKIEIKMHQFSSLIHIQNCCPKTCSFILDQSSFELIT